MRVMVLVFLRAWIMSKIEQKVHALNYENDTRKVHFHQSKLSRKIKSQYLKFKNLFTAI